MGWAQRAPVAQAEIAALLDQHLHALVLAPHRLAQPGEVVPHQQVDEELLADVDAGFRVLEKTARHFRQPAVGDVAADQGLFIGAQALAEQLQPLTTIGRQHRIGQRRQQGVADTLAVGEEGLDLAGVIVQLLQQGGGEIDHRARLRLGLEMGRHVGVILDGVQIGPRQLILAVRAVAILRLMHVPAQHHVQAGLLRLVG